MPPSGPLHTDRYDVSDSANGRNGSIRALLQSASVGALFGVLTAGIELAAILVGVLWWGDVTCLRRSLFVVILLPPAYGLLGCLAGLAWGCVLLPVSSGLSHRTGRAATLALCLLSFLAVVWIGVPSWTIVPKAAYLLFGLGASAMIG